MKTPPFRTGSVAIVGRPNVGKSTLVNRLVGAHVAITSRKAQTTRHRIHGISTDERSQFVFVDTPGYQKEHTSALNRLLNRTAGQAAADVDVVVMVVEAIGTDERDERVLELLPDKVPVILALNKMDRVKDRNRLAEILQAWDKRRNFAALVPVSATKGTQVERLREEIRKLLPEGPPAYPADEFTDRNERFLASELIRERLFRLLGDELPYSTAVVVDSFEMDGALRRIAATIFVDKPGQKPIVVGEKGATLKRVGTEARHAMEGLFGGKVYLELWVRVKRGWADNQAAIRQFGYE